MRERQPCIYILASGHNDTLYVGVTSDLLARLMQHRADTFDGFTKRHCIIRLVYFEVADTMEAAITREKQLKRYRREWKMNLIERENPTWDDLAVGVRAGAVGGSARVDRGPRHEAGVTGKVPGGASPTVTPDLFRGPPWDGR